MGAWWGMEQILSYWPFALAMLATGVASGVMAGLLGVGGGSIIVPVLATALALMQFGNEVIQHVAVATSLAVIIPTGISSARSHHKRGAVDVRVLKLWAPMIFVATLAGGLMARWYSGDVLRIVFGVLALVIAANILLPFQEKLIGHLKSSNLAHRVAALVVGYLSALMGIGGGSFTVPTLHAFGAPMHTAVGTSAAIGVAIAVAGTIGFMISGWGVPGLPPFSLGYVNVVAFAFIAVTAYLSAPLGAALAHRLNQRALKLVFAGFMIFVGLGMIWKAVA
jgi:uncharacterized membrane protein YfcA